MMLGQRRRRLPSIKPAVGERFSFAACMLTHRSDHLEILLEVSDVYIH